MKKVIILGSVSFVLDNSKVGINWIAEYLALHNYQVTYVSSASTILDLFFKAKRKRFFAAWLRGGVFQLQPNLTEVIFKSPWLLNRLTYRFQHKTAAIFESKLLNSQYDILISTVGALSLFSQRVKAPLKILRLQDHPHDFGLSDYVVNNLENLQRNSFDQIWAVSQQLYDYAAQFSSKENIYLPNGIKLDNFIANFSATISKKAVYVGVFSKWVNISLICEAAKLLPEWQFDLFGPGFPKSYYLPKNITYHGELANTQLVNKLPQYAVGLIPFIDCPHIKVVERPLKFAQYLASGLGVASVNYGALRQGMQDWACYGNTPEEFANAIENAYSRRNQWTKEMIVNYLRKYDWDTILAQMVNLLEKANA